MIWYCLMLIMSDIELNKCITMIIICLIISKGEIQKWDDLVSAGYKNIRTNPVTSPKRKLVVWDGQRDQKDFLKEMASTTLGYGAEGKNSSGKIHS